MVSGGGVVCHLVASNFAGGPEKQIIEQSLRLPDLHTGQLDLESRSVAFAGRVWQTIVKGTYQDVASIHYALQGGGDAWIIDKNDRNDRQPETPLP